ncbi:MAG: TPR repeat-containing protein YrrB [Deltaproteobacteria bacterium ADurb.Bin207]|nr:MAG: TPR repeat-containing protein YrrB [Deltaproteobacteria bacterium ADurb.Bin207]
MRGLLVVGAFVFSSCASPPSTKEPVRTVAMPGLQPVESNDQGDSPPGNDVASARSPDPLPPLAVVGLARGTGTPADQALARGDDAYRNEQWDAASEAYLQAQRLAPTDPAPLVGQVRVALAKADAPTAHAADPQQPLVRQSVAKLRQARRLDPSYGPALVELGQALLVLDESEEALSVLQAAVQQLPSNPDALSALGVALLANGRSQEAVNALQKAVELDPGSIPRLTNLATAWLLQGETSRAVEVYERAVLLAPDDGRIHTDLGTAYLALNDLQKAMRHLRRAVEIDPNRATFRSNLGYGLLSLGDTTGAIEQCRKALELDAKLGSAWINLGTALARTGKRQQARQAFERAVALDPTDPRPRANLQELDEIERAGAAP